MADVQLSVNLLQPENNTVEFKTEGEDGGACWRSKTETPAAVCQDEEVTCSPAEYTEHQRHLCTFYDSHGSRDVVLKMV